RVMPTSNHEYHPRIRQPSRDAAEFVVLTAHVDARLLHGRYRDPRAHKPRTHDTEPPHRRWGRWIGDAEILLELGRREEDLHQLARYVGHRELPEELGLALQPLRDAVLQTVLDDLEGRERCRVVAPCLLH